MSTTVEKIIEQVRSLPPDEQRHIVEQLNAIVPSLPGDEEIEERVERQLAAEGLISLPEPSENGIDDDWEPIEVQGQPLSEMIIEERR